MTGAQRLLRDQIELEGPTLQIVFAAQTKLNTMASAAKKDRWRVSDQVWEEMQRFLPLRKPHPLGCHRPRVPDRSAMNAILFVLRTGCQWAALDATGICSHASAHRRFMEWKQAGVFEHFWAKGLMSCPELRGIDWGWLNLDSAPHKDHEDHEEPAQIAVLNQNSPSQREIHQPEAAHSLVAPFSPNGVLSPAMETMDT